MVHVTSWDAEEWYERVTHPLSSLLTPSSTLTPSSYITSLLSHIPPHTSHPSTLHPSSHITPLHSHILPLTSLLTHHTPPLSHPLTSLLPHPHTVREELRELAKEFDKSEDDLKSLQSGVGQIVGEVLRQLTEDKCEWSLMG